MRERQCWRDVPHDVDIVLKRAFLAGFASVTYSEMGREYDVDLAALVRRSLISGEECEMKVPFGWSAPSQKKMQSAKPYQHSAQRARNEATPARLTLADALMKMEEDLKRSGGLRGAQPLRVAPRRMWSTRGQHLVLRQRNRSSKPQAPPLCPPSQRFSGPAHSAGPPGRCPGLWMADSNSSQRTMPSMLVDTGVWRAIWALRLRRTLVLAPCSSSSPRRRVALRRSARPSHRSAAG